MEGNDVWWTIRDGSSAETASKEVLPVLESKGIPFLDGLTSAQEILGLYAGGQVLGFEIDRDEERLILLAETRAIPEARERLREYEVRWPLSPANERASKFLMHFKESYSAETGVVGPEGQSDS